jgi:hypothetical protein
LLRIQGCELRSQGEILENEACDLQYSIPRILICGAGVNGKDLETFVADLERLLLPPEFHMEVRRREYGSGGVQVAEFDIVITGRLGSATMSWLIECRDRPAEGPAPGAWIEQLVGRRDRFNFDKVMAVSTTGFAAGAAEYAQQKGIELRSVAHLSAADFTEWFLASQFDVVRRSMHLEDAEIYISEEESLDRQAAVLSTSFNLDDKRLHTPLTDLKVSLGDAFTSAVAQHPELWPSDVHGKWQRDVKIDAHYPEGEQYKFETLVGMIAIPRILFKGRLQIQVTSFPHVRFLEYTDAVSKCRVASSVSADFNVGEHELSVTFERVTINGLHNLAVRVRRTQ